MCSRTHHTEQPVCSNDGIRTARWSGPARANTDHAQTDANLQHSLLAMPRSPLAAAAPLRPSQWKLPPPGGMAGSMVRRSEMSLCSHLLASRFEAPNLSGKEARGHALSSSQPACWIPHGQRHSRGCIWPTGHL
ncbi:hypothetical protein K456DRAFT_221023 [Colletotrichum gloeosporioides 23]|nr:hypothetical protein K456DRAFT_221023 [Colletotrichum gloeosporioides 23]